MKRFKQFLTEKAMSRQEAIKVLGLSSSFTPDDLKAAYRMLSRKYHPDLNPGDKVAGEKMREVNNANDVLSDPKNQAVGTAARDAEWKEREEKADVRRKVYAQIAVNAFEEHFKAHAFAQHFAKVFGQPFTHKILKNPSAEVKVGSYSLKRDYVDRLDEWFTADRSIVMTASFSISFSELLNKVVLSAGDAETNLNVTIGSDVLVNRKKVKLFQKSYRWRESYKAMSDPEVIFPAKKMTTQSGKAAERKMSKRDVMLTFTSELDARGDEEWMYVPVGQYRVALYRVVLMRHGSWSIRGVYPAKGGSSVAAGYVGGTWLEDPEDMHRLFDDLKKLQRDGENWTPDQIMKALKDIEAKQKRERSWGK